MATERVGAGKAPAAAPYRAGLEVAFADELLFPGVQALVPLAVVLAGKGLAADGADERSFVGVRAEVGSEVVGAREPLRAEVALESGRVLLYALAVVVGRGSLGICEVEDVVSLVGSPARAPNAISERPVATSRWRWWS